MIDTIDDYEVTVPIQERLEVEVLAAIIIHFYSNGIDKYDDMVSALYGRTSYNYSMKKLDIDLNNKTTLQTRPSIKKP